jgi:hypothetical protein
MEKLVNDWEFAKTLDKFLEVEVNPLGSEVNKAFGIVNDLNYKWRDEAQKEIGIAKYKQMDGKLRFLRSVYIEGKNLCVQHETLVNNLAKWYDKWYNDISNNGKQEAEIMEAQADMLNGIFSEIFEVLQPLNLDIKPPNALNL